MPPALDTRLNWAAYRTKIEELYWFQKKELPEVMKIMEDDHGFVATQKMYKKQLKAWGLQKNIKTSEMMAMIRIEGRRRGENKKTQFIRHGIPVEPEKLRRFARRHKLELGETLSPSDQQAATPPDITYNTPEPDTLSSTLPLLAAQADFNPGRKKAEKTDPVISTGPRDLETNVSPSSGNPCWVSSSTICWPASDAPNNAQSSPNPPTMDDLFISQAFSGPGVPDLSCSPSRDFTEGVFSPPASRWAGYIPDTGYHECLTRADGIPPWIFVSQASHHAVQPPSYGPDRMFPSLLHGYSAAMAQPTSQMLNFSNVQSPARGIIMTRDAAGSSLGDSPLHDSVIEGNASQTRILLEAGANQNCTVRGGVTPIHCAAFQRNIEHVSILQEYGANLSAVTDKGQSILLFAVKRRMIGASDMLSSHSHTKQNTEPKASELHTDDATLAVINALYDSPAGWPRLLQSLNQPDKDGVTPLMLAAEAGFIKTVTMFLQRGARPDLRDHVGYTALKYAASGGHRDLVRLLLEADVRVQERDLSHLLKLGSKNLTTTAAACPSPSTTTTSPVYHVHGDGKDGGGWWERRRKCDGEVEEERDDDSSATIAEEMVKLLREMGVGALEGLIRLAEQKRKLGVLEALLAAVRRLDVAVVGVEKRGSQLEHSSGS